MKIVVSPELCTGHARCEAVAGRVYATDPAAGCVLPVDGPVPPEHEAAAIRGARACPERAISVLGGPDDSETLWPLRPR